MKRIFLLSVPILMASCETFDDSSRNDQYARMQYQTARSQDQQAAQLSASVNALAASNAEIIRYMTDLNAKIAALQQNNAALQKEIGTVRQELDAARKSWQTANEKMIDQITRDINGAMKSATAATPSKSGPEGSGEFHVYKVEPGATLNAIAKAYGVGVAEIKAANRMSNDLIRVGQTLYIPKK